jgi:hypothetical protein
MSRIQKIVLTAFALVDVLVIAILGYVVISSQVSQGADASQGPSETCGTRLLESLPHIPGYDAIVTYNQSLGELHVALFANTSSSAGFTTEGAQSLWPVLSRVAPHANRWCPYAKTLILTVETLPPQDPAYHIGRFPMSAVSDWINGELSDNQLADVSGYRYIPRPTPYYSSYYEFRD